MSVHGAEHNLTVDAGGIDLAGVDLSRAVWKKSSFSGGNGSCVEVADLGEYVVVRDSKDKAGPKLVFNRDVWRVFVEGIKTGVYNR
jgi:hypothetical protein